MSKTPDVFLGHTPATELSLSSKEYSQKKDDKDGSPTLNEAKRLLSRLPEEITIQIYDKTPLPTLLDQFELEHSSYIKKRCKTACETSFLFPEEEDEPDFVLEFKNYLSMLQNKTMPESYRQRINRVGQNVMVGEKEKINIPLGYRVWCKATSLKPRSTVLFWANDPYVENPPVLLKLDHVFVLMTTVTNHKVYLLISDHKHYPTAMSILRFDPATGKILRICNIPMQGTNDMFRNFYAADYNTSLFAFENDSPIRIFTVKGDEVEEKHMPGKIVAELKFNSEVVVYNDEDGVHKILKTVSIVKDEVIERVFQRNSRWITGGRIGNQFFYVLDDTKRRIWYQEEPGAVPILIHEDDQPLHVEQFIFSTEELNTWMSGNPHGPVHPTLR